MTGNFQKGQSSQVVTSLLAFPEMADVNGELICCNTVVLLIMKVVHQLISFTLANDWNVCSNVKK